MPDGLLGGSGGGGVGEAEGGRQKCSFLFFFLTDVIDYSFYEYKSDGKTNRNADCGQSNSFTSLLLY